jgi:hypothetical protein
VDVQITCPCPGSPHAQDTVTLRDRLTFAGGLAVRQRIVDAVTIRLGEDDIVATMTEGYILHGIGAWTLVGDDGKPLPLTLANIRLHLPRRLLGPRHAARRGGERALRNPGDRPFSQGGVELIAGFADERIDVSDFGGHTEDEGEALTAILDLHYPDGRHRDDYRTAQWRLQLLAELGVGKRLRQYADREDEAVRKLHEATG